MRFFSWQALSIGIAFVGLAASIAIGLGILDRQARQLSFRFLSVDELTLAPTVEGLKGTFTYQGADVAHLWKVDSRITNTGDTTVVGDGAQTGLLRPELIAEFPESFNVVNAQITRSDIGPVELMFTGSKLSLIFEQWRKSESVEVILFVTSSSPAAVQDLILSFPGRQLIDGEILFIPLAEIADPQRSYLEKLPRPVVVLARVAGLTFSILLAIIFVAGAATLIGGYLSWVRWRKYEPRFRDELREYIQGKGGVSAKARTWYAGHINELVRHASTLSDSDSASSIRFVAAIEDQDAPSGWDFREFFDSFEFEPEPVSIPANSFLANAIGSLAFSVAALAILLAAAAFWPL